MSTSARSPPGVIYGPGLTVSIDKEEVLDILNNILPKHKITMLDTARLYAGSEAHLQSLGIVKNFRITTKVLLGQNKKESVLKSAKESFDALQVEKVEVYLLHAPDAATPIEETMEAIQELYLQGKFEKVGIQTPLRFGRDVEGGS